MRDDANCSLCRHCVQDAGGEVIGRKQKRKYEKRKHKSGSNQYQTSTEIDVMDYGSTEDEPISPVRSFLLL